jgi:hypothetical protein
MAGVLTLNRFSNLVELKPRILTSAVGNLVGKVVARMMFDDMVYVATPKK